MGKLVYQDGDRIKAYRGILLKEDNMFVYFETEQDKELLRINKKFVVSLVSGGKYDDKDN